MMLLVACCGFVLGAVGMLLLIGLFGPKRRIG